MIRQRLAWLVAVAVFLVALPALAFRVPPIQGHVTDLAGALDSGQTATLDRQMQDVDIANGAEIAV